MLDDIEIRLKGGRWLTPAERVKFVGENLASIMIPALKEQGLVVREKIDKHEMEQIDMVKLKLGNHFEPGKTRMLQDYFASALMNLKPEVDKGYAGQVAIDMCCDLMKALEKQGYYIVKKTEEA